MNVKAVREKLGLSQQSLAMCLGVHALTISKWERGVLSPDKMRHMILSSVGELSKPVSLSLGREIALALASEGQVTALYKLLRSFHEDYPKKGA